MLFLFTLITSLFLHAESHNPYSVPNRAKNYRSGKNHPCFRECNGTSMVCEYNFRITLQTSMDIHCKNCPFNQSDCYNNGCIMSGGIVRQVITVNKKIPGPEILVCENDTIVVKVTNYLPLESTTIHWHGVHQKASPYMDGVPFITQCPIQSFSSFEYKFSAYPHGTHIWHGHSDFQESDGLYGPLVIRRDEPENIRNLYDFDLPQHTLIIWHWTEQPTSHELPIALHRNDSVSGFGLLINGKAAFKKFWDSEKNEFVTTPIETLVVEPGFRYRFRMIYNSAVYCPLQISIDDHKILLMASETSTFEPFEVDSFIMSAGERFDFVFSARKCGGCYIMRFRGLGDCDELKSSVHGLAYVCYGNETLKPSGPTTYDQGRRTGVLFNPVQEAETDYSNNTLIHLTELNNTEITEPYNGTPDVTYYIQVHSRPYNSYIYPGPWHQLNDVTFNFVGPTLLSERFTLGANDTCSDETKHNFCDGDYCSCRYVKKIPLNSLVELVLVDISVERNQDHPMHLHGYHFYPVALEAVGKNISVEDIKQRNKAGKIKKNLKTAVTKDSISVPSKGFAVLRFIARNPGYWIFHCHTANHVALGMALVFQVGEDNEMAPVPLNFPSCRGIFSNNTNRKNHSFFNAVIASTFIFLISVHSNTLSTCIFFLELPSSQLQFSIDRGKRIFKRVKI